MSSDIYTQIGLVMLIGMAAKNAILIVEFAKLATERGTPLIEAALEGARLRLRPIIMTSFAFILGCVPLWRVMGTTVIGGMLAATLIAIFLIPVCYYVVERLAAKRRNHAPQGAPAEGNSTAQLNTPATPEPERSHRG